MNRKIIILISILFSSVLFGDTADLESYLIAHYKMNDNAANSTVTDSSDNSYDGNYKDSGGNINTDTGSTTGRVNEALDFDGGDEYVEIADQDAFTPAGTAFSISVWVYMHDATGFHIASKGVFDTDGEWRWWIHTDDYMYVLFYDESDNLYIGRKNVVQTLTAYENQWIHLVLTYDGGTSDTGIKLYINGSLFTTTSYSFGAFVAVENLTHAVWIGRYSGSHADGLIDNVMFFSKELDSDDISFLWNGGGGREDFTHYLLIRN